MQYPTIRLNNPNKSHKNHEIYKLDPNLRNQLLGPHFASDWSRTLSERTANRNDSERSQPNPKQFDLDTSYTATRDQNKFEWFDNLSISRLYFAASIAAPDSNRSGTACPRRHNIQPQAWNGNLAFTRAHMFNRTCHVVFFAKPYRSQTKVVSDLRLHLYAATSEIERACHGFAPEKFAIDLVINELSVALRRH